MRVKYSQIMQLNGVMGKKIPNTLYHIDKHIDQLYDTQKNADEGMTSKQIPNT